MRARRVSAEPRSAVRVRTWACAALVLGCACALLLAPAAAQDPTESFAGTSLRQSYILEQLTSASMLSFRPVGSTSTVFRTLLRSTIGAAFKAATERKPYGPQSEVAAYRLARCLGLANVPPAVLRYLPASTLQAGIDAEHSSQWPEISQRLIMGRDDKVLGAAIYWVEGMRGTGLDTTSGQARVAAWHNVALPLPEADASLAADASTMVAFDYLIGNWDRWSGGNVKSDPSGQHLYLRDHDAALPTHLSEALHRHMLDRLTQTQRFSRSFYAALRGLSRESYRRELERDPAFASAGLWDPTRIDHLFDRRATLLSHISALIDEYGANKVLVFP